MSPLPPPESAPLTTGDGRTGGRGITKTILAIAFVASFVIVAHDLWLDWQVGGNSWRQGDWLINQDLVLIRRGPFGSFLLALTRMTSLPPLATLIALQALLLGLLHTLMWRVYSRTEPIFAALLVTLSCGSVIVFWAADPAGALRKEILGMVALLVGFTTLFHPSPWRMWGAVILLGMAGFAHEANTFFAPTLAVLIWLASAPQTLRRQRWPALIITFGLAALGLGYALTHVRIADATAVCAPLLEQGMDVSLCEGAIQWLEYGVKNSIIEMRRQLLYPRPVFTVSLGYGLALLPFAILAHLSKRFRLCAALALLTALPFVPLFILSVDWGRWISLHLFSLSLIFLALFQTGRLKMHRTAHPGVIVLLALPALFYGIGHVWTPHYGGFVLSLIQVIFPN